jgi:hypothetical protein
VLWAAGILALLVVLIVHGGFQRPLAFIVWPVIIVGTVLGFWLFSSRTPQGKGRRRAESAPLHDAQPQRPAEFPAAAPEEPRPPP